MALQASFQRGPFQRGPDLGPLHPLARDPGPVSRGCGAPSNRNPSASNLRPLGRIVNKAGTLKIFGVNVVSVFKLIAEYVLQLNACLLVAAAPPAVQIQNNAMQCIVYPSIGVCIWSVASLLSTTNF